MRYYWYLYRPIYWGWGNLENPYWPTSFGGIPQLTCEVPCLPTDLMAAMVSMHATDAVPADPPDATHATEMAVEAEGNWVQWKESSFNNDFHNKTSMYPGFLICWSDPFLFTLATLWQVPFGEVCWCRWPTGLARQKARSLWQDLWQVL